MNDHNKTCAKCVSMDKEGYCNVWGLMRDDLDYCDAWVSRDPETIRDNWESLTSRELAAELRRGGFCVQRYGNQQALMSLSACPGSCTDCISDFIDKECRKE